MNDSGPDLHVVSLRYVLRSTDGVTYISPPPVEFETPEVRFKLAEGKLVCEMKTHFQTAEAARAVVEPILAAWEVTADLRRSPDELRFKFDGAEIIDRSPPPPGAIRGHAHMFEHADTLSATGTVSLHMSRPYYPEPPGTFRLSPDAESLYLRYQGYLAGREPLPGMAYFCLTVLEASAGCKRGRRAFAAKAYRIDKEVLDKMGELTSCRGDRLTARKATAGPVQPLTGPENTWLDAAVTTLILRLGDTRDETVLPLITLSDLPSL